MNTFFEWVTRALQWFLLPDSMPMNIIAAVYLALVLLFLFRFFIRSIIHLARLQRIHGKLKRLNKAARSEEYAKIFSADTDLAHLWSEFDETLHKVTEDREGQSHITSVRATVSFAAFFSDQYVVDGRLGTEFFKHLPGIFTGLGIIGTFSGLISGLKKFEVSENADVARQSLNSLMHHVNEAFVVSAIALATAIAVTLLEKLILAWLYKRTEAIAHTVDANFDAGIGEEYLARLVKASDESTSQMKILKDSLVSDLGTILREITATQLAATKESNQALGNVISSSIERSLKAPLEEIANVVKTASGDQSTAAVTMLNDVMVSFSQRISDLFGGQINGINELNKQSAHSMQEAVAALHTLIGSMENSGKRATDEMANQMAASISAMEERQSNINAQTQNCIEQISQLVQNTQAESQQKLRSTLDSVAQQMDTILTSLGTAQSEALEANRSREQAMAERAAGLIGDLSGSVDSAIKEMTAATQTMAQSVAALTSTTSSSIEKMNSGVERLGHATTKFATVGEHVSAVMDKAANVSGKLTELAGQLSTSSSSLQDVLRDYQAQRQALVTLLSEMRTIVEMARKEASLTADILQRIESSAAKLGEAQLAADVFLNGVGQVLAESSEKFSASAVSALNKVNYEFHEKLSHAVGLLSSSIQELEETFGSLPPRR